MIDSRPRKPWDKTAPAEREYFDLLGEGLVAVVPPRRPGGGPGGWSPPTGGAWVHVGKDGNVRGFIGKVEVGQGTRTALALLVAEELKVPLAQVEMVMGDTDLSPWDMGTFGSLSMPVAAPALRAAAATARVALVELAAAAEHRPVSELTAEEGEVRPKGEKKGRSYASLVAGLKKVVVAGPDAPLTPPTAWTVAGHPTIDAHAEDVVTGRQTYTSDLRPSGMLYGAILLPPRYGAGLVRADVSRLEARRDIHLVHEGNFVGVVASTPWEAHHALSMVDAEWQETPQPSEGEIEGYLRAHPATGDAWDTGEQKTGDPTKAFASAPVKLEATYRATYIAHVPLETRATVASWEGSRLTVWVGTQTPFRARERLATALGIPEEQVRVIVPATGSGFGGKHGGDVALGAARLSRAVGKPVQVVYSRAEEFQHGYFRPWTAIDVRAAADRDGRILAWTYHNVNGGGGALLPPYEIPNQAVDNELSDSPLPQGPYRGVGANVNNFARESAVDELASGAGIDPLDLRERNLKDERLREVLHRAAATAGWAGRSKTSGKGFGLALGLEKSGRVATIAEVAVGADRTFRLDRIVTAYEAGAIVNPDNLRSQVEGATVMALGGALFEEIHFDGGVILNRRLSEYRVPRFSDAPKVEVVLVDRPDVPPAGAGETPMIAVAPALANAIFDATGTRLRSLPLVPTGKVPRAPLSARK